MKDVRMNEFTTIHYGTTLSQHASNDCPTQQHDARVVRINEMPQPHVKY